MRCIAKAVALAAVLALMVPSIILAADYIKDAAEVLKHSPVYVAPGTEETDNDTAGKLQARLEGNDNIVLVMLPFAAKAELDADISTIANRLSQELKNQRIIGLAVGDEVVGYAPTLPAGVAADQMRRAKSVSNDPLTALGTFAQNMHLWQREHPQPKPAPFEPPSSGGIPWFVWLLISLLVVGVAIALIARWVGRSYTPSTERSRFRVPDQVEDPLEAIMRKRGQVRDQGLQSVLYQLGVDVEKYFQLSSKDEKRDALFFRDRLVEVTQVLDKYLDVQDNPRYYNNPNSLLQEGKEGLTEFSEWVLVSIRRGTDEDLSDYRLNTSIMQARRSLEG